TLSSSPSRDRIFVCYPQQPAEERACAEQIARHLATRAYRRPVTDADVAKLMSFYESGCSEIGHFDGGVQKIILSTIASPDFLYRVLTPRAGSLDFQPLDDLGLASRLALFLWSVVPVGEPRRVAVEGKLRDEAVSQQQVDRMLRDRRAAALV